MKFLKIALFCIGCFSFHGTKIQAEQGSLEGTNVKLLEGQAQSSVEELIDFIGDEIQRKEEVSLSPEAKERLGALQRQNDLLNADIEKRQSRVSKLQKSQSKKQDFSPQIKAQQNSIKSSKQQVAINDRKIEEIKESN